jgi:hypothetical protein
MMTCADHADLSFRKNESKWHQLVDAGDNRLYPIACNWTEAKEVCIVIRLAISVPIDRNENQHKQL